jgi:hypothetical protein
METTRPAPEAVNCASHICLMVPSCLGTLLSCILPLITVLILPAGAQESPYIVTYDHLPRRAGQSRSRVLLNLWHTTWRINFHAYWMEFEYGVKAWYTTEFYLDGQSTFGESTIFTGFRWENRVRLLDREHLINPVLYVEYEQISDADKIVKEVEGHDVESDQAIPNATARQTVNHELEFKLLLSKTFKGWNVAVNPLVTKNLSPSESWEFGRPTARTEGIGPPVQLLSGELHRRSRNVWWPG